MPRTYRSWSEYLRDRKGLAIVGTAAATSACNSAAGEPPTDDDTSAFTVTPSTSAFSPSPAPQAAPQAPATPVVPPQDDAPATGGAFNPSNPPSDAQDDDPQDAPAPPPPAAAPAPQGDTGGGNDSDAQDAQDGEPANAQDPQDNSQDDTVDGDNGDGDNDNPDGGADDGQTADAPAQSDGPQNDAPAPAAPPPASSTGDEAAFGAPELLLPIENVSTVEGGRVSTFDLGPDVASVRIADGPEVGNLTVNPDNTLALVLSMPDAKDHTGNLSFELEVSYTDGSTQNIAKSLNVTPVEQGDGWGHGDFYMLETDEDGELVIEHGDNHRVIHISGSESALSREDIAQIEGIGVSQVDGAFLAANPQYGATPDMALDDRMGRTLWEELTGPDAEPGSHWMLFEKGHEYYVDRLIQQGTNGEDELHPLYIGSYGEGELPVLSGDLRSFQEGSWNIVVRDVQFDNKFQVLSGGNYILDGIHSSGEEIAFQNLSAMTLRDSTILDATTEVPTQGGDTWNANLDRASGFFANGPQGLLVEGNFFDHNGWEAGYDYYMSTDYGLAPSQFNHNVYINHKGLDVTFRDNIVMRGASFGAQIRPGGFIEDNVFVDNNIGVNFLGGIVDGEHAGNFTLFTDNVVSNGGFHVVADFEGATTWGIGGRGMDSTLLDNIIAHLVEPGVVPEFHEEYNDAKKTIAINEASEETVFYNNTVVYNWAMPDGNKNEPDANVGGLDPAALDQITIQNFTRDLLGDPNATVDDLAEHLRTEMSLDSSDPLTADDIIAYFQQGFGIYDGPERTSTETLRFVPDSLGDGIRWDNRINWDTEDIPMDGDSVDLASNWVYYGGTTVIEDLDFGSGGELQVNHGHLTIDGQITSGDEGGELGIDKAGQVWMNGYDDTDALSVDLSGGRLANTGDFNGTADISVTDGQAILATSGADMTLGEGSRLTITGSEADVGFDGDDGDTATLQLDGGRIDFVADEDGFAGIEEFRSGAFGDAPDVLSGIDLGDGVLGIDITALNGSALQDKLFGADEILGSFETIELIGLAENQDATITFDYETDEVIFNVTAAGDGSGQANVAFNGDMMDASNSGDLWNALTEGQGTYSETDPPQIEEPDEFTALVA